MEKVNGQVHPPYSVAIRTLGLNPGVLKNELESVWAQTVAPAKVVVYIARGYVIPEFRVGKEVYVPTQKGMVAQRAMDYREIDTPLILLLDDDVILAPDTMERLLKAMDAHSLDCIAADTFANHKMPLHAKIFAAVTNLTFPHRGQGYAFKMKANGSFSYLNRPAREVYLSQTAAGPCSLWHKDALLATAFAEELWMDHLGFAYNDDGMEFYKLHTNGGRLGVHFDSGVVNENARTMSDSYRSDPRRFELRAKAIYLCWHRSLYAASSGPGQKLGRALAFWTKATWMLPVHIVTAMAMKNASIPLLYLKGLREGIRYTHTAEYRAMPPYRKMKPKHTTKT